MPAPSRTGQDGVEVIRDRHGHFTDGVFAHKRLAIIDVAPARSRCRTPDGRYLLTFNGEIYNYIELREN